MKRIVALLLLLAGVGSVMAETRRRSVRSPGRAALPVANFIDTHVGAKLAASSIAPAAIAGDEEFLRRVTLDLTGAIPTASDVLAFVADTRGDKRARKIDELLQSDAFTDRWTLWFGDLVQNVQVANNSREYYLGKNAYHAWIRESIRSAMPYDAMVREVLAGEGDNFQVGVANYIVRQIQRNGPPPDTLDNLAAHSVEKFLGIPALCISCHDGAGHLELVNWWLRGKKREDFWKMAAFFSRTAVRGQRYIDPANPNANVIKYLVAVNPIGAYPLGSTDGNKSPRVVPPGAPATVAPAFITNGETPRAGEPYRIAYGRILTADRQFARATMNVLWKEMMGRGFVEPVNSFDLTKLDTQPTHPALLEALADELIAKNFSLREVLRTIALSKTYQLSSTYAGTHPDAAYFARRSPRRLHSEVLFDAVTTATGVAANLPVNGAAAVSKAVQLPDPLDGGNRRSPAGLFLNNFGRGNRDDILRSNDAAITQSLSLMNDTVITTRVKRANNSTVQKVLAASSDPATITDQLYLATLSRHPTAQERQIATDYLRAGTLSERAEDLQYVLLNSLEFLFN
ncbi:MAG TPA: DUF1549 domain-containing protein [Thermoanaerobaculia bacterium]|nr:DUF1549 domain-containing protein [Thermoanaerobaculia bacterium]